MIGVGLGCLGAWALFAHAWLLIFALAFLAEEILESGIMALALRRRPRPGGRPQNLAAAARATSAARKKEGERCRLGNGSVFRGYARA